MKQNKENKIVFFDFDGVLVDSFEIVFQANREVHSPSLTKHEMRKSFEGNFYEVPAKKKKSWFNQANMDDYWKVYDARLSEVSIIAGYPAMLKDLSSHYILTIVSSAHGKIIKSFLKRHKVLKYFDQILGSDAHLSKVAKIDLSLKRHGTKPEMAIFITDTLGDILEAKACGVRSVAVTSGFHFERTLRKGKPVKIVKNAKELTKAIHQYLK